MMKLFILLAFIACSFAAAMPAPDKSYAQNHSGQPETAMTPVGLEGAVVTTDWVKQRITIIIPAQKIVGDVIIDLPKISNEQEVRAKIRVWIREQERCRKGKWSANYKWGLEERMVQLVRGKAAHFPLYRDNLSYDAQYQGIEVIAEFAKAIGYTSEICIEVDIPIAPKFPSFETRSSSFTLESTKLGEPLRPTIHKKDREEKQECKETPVVSEALVNPGLRIADLLRTRDSQIGYFGYGWWSRQIQQCTPPQPGPNPTPPCTPLPPVQNPPGISTGNT